MKPTTVDEYILNSPKELRPKLRQLRLLIIKTAPQAQEKLSYGMPYYGYNGRLAYFAYAKNHIGLYIMPKVLEKFRKEVKELRTGKATLRLSLDEPLPVSLIKKMIKAGVIMNERDKSS